MPAKRTTKTEFARYLNEYGIEVDSVSKYIADYHQALKNGKAFGMWLRVKQPEIFNAAYNKWWLKNEQLWGVIYDDVEDTYEPYE